MRFIKIARVLESLTSDIISFTETKKSVDSRENIEECRVEEE
jgi:hypothetical protein